MKDDIKNKLRVQDMKTKIAAMALSIEDTRSAMLAHIQESSSIPDTHKEVLTKVVDAVFEIPGSNPLIQDDIGQYHSYNPKKATEFLIYHLGEKFSYNQIQNIIREHSPLVESIHLYHKIALLAAWEGESGLPDNLAELYERQRKDKM